MTKLAATELAIFCGDDAIDELERIQGMVSRGDQVPWAIPMGIGKQGAYKIAGITPRPEDPDFTELVVVLPATDGHEQSLGQLPCYGLYDHRELAIERSVVNGTTWWILSEVGDMGYFDLAVCFLPEGVDPPVSINRSELTP